MTYQIDRSQFIEGGAALAAAAAIARVRNAAIYGALAQRKNAEAGKDLAKAA